MLCNGLSSASLMVIFQSRFEPLYIKMRETIQAVSQD